MCPRFQQLAEGPTLEYLPKRASERRSWGKWRARVDWHGRCSLGGLRFASRFEEDTVTSTFRLVALLVSAVALFTGQVHAQGAVEQATFDLPAVRDPQLGAQIAIADQFGYFKDEGLTVTVKWQQSGADIITLMASGQQGVAGGGSFAQIVLGGQKLPVRTIAPLANIAGTQGFVLSPKTKLASPKDLEGQKPAHTPGKSQVL